MAQPLRVLMVEDSENDALLLAQELKRKGYEPSFERVDTAEALRRALREGDWDIVLADYSMPGFTGMEALSIVQETGRDVPFILVSGSVGEDLAVEAMRVGAHDYIMKNNLPRLSVAVERELRDAESRLLRRKAEIALKETNQTLWALVKSSPLAIMALDLQRNVTMWNPAAERMFGWSEREVLGTTLPIVPKDKHPEFRGLFERAMQGRSTANLETQRKRKDGRLIDVALTTAALHDSQGKVIGVMAVLADITERMRAEKLAQEVETRNRAILKSAIDGIIVIDHRGLIMEFNPAAERILGHKRESVLGRELAELIIPPALREAHRQGMRRYLATGQGKVLGQLLEMTALRADGTEFPVELSIQRIGLSEPPLFTGFIRDISKRKFAEEALRRNQALLTKMQQMAHLGGWELDLSNLEDINKNELRWTDESFRIFGYKPGEVEVTNDLFFQSVHPEDRPKIVEAVSRALAEKTSYSIEHRILLSNGAERVVHERADIVFDEKTGKPLRMYGSVQDITEEKRAEGAQKEREKLAHLAAEIGVALTQSVSQQEMLTRCSEILVRNLDAAFARVWTLNEKDQVLELQASAGMYTHLDGPHGRVPVGKFKIGLIAQERKPHLTNAVIGDPRVGDQEWAKREGMVAFAGYPLIIEGRLLGVMAMFARHPLTDFTLKALSSVADQISLGIERKRGEAALRESEERFRQFAESSKDVIWITDVELTETLYVNPAYESVFDRSLTSVYAEPRSWMETLHPEDREKLLVPGAAGIPGEVFTQEFRIVRKDGSIRWIRSRVIPIKNDAGQPYRQAGIAEDITKEKTLTEQLRQAQKMEAVGQLAGGIAHDFNNLLTAIDGYNEFALEQVAPGNPLRGDLEEIKKATQRAASLTRQLLAFSRRQLMQLEVLNLNELVGGMEGMLRRLIGENIELVTVSAPDLAAVKADPHQVEQVIMNLAVNAQDAMPKGGRLTIETANVELDEAFVQEHVGAQSGAYVMLAVSDTGFGMDAEVQKHLFEPFFTTKEKGKGTGLGLSTAYGIVKQSGGYISVYSEPGHGSCFKIYLPQIVEPAPEKPVKATPAKTAGGTETIFLVEDEVAVRVLAAKILRAKGYTVLEAGDGKEAQAVLKAHTGALDLLLTDVVMPSMGGPELAKWLRCARRGVKVLFMTGYTDLSAFQEGSLPPGTALLSKPFSPQALVQKVREILDGSKNASLPSDKTEKQKKPATRK